MEYICTISADLSRLSGALEQRSGADGIYWMLRFKVGIRFGGTELQAYLEWNEGVSDSVPEFNMSFMPHYIQGVTRKSQAQIIPNSLM